MRPSHGRKTMAAVGAGLAATIAGTATIGIVAFACTMVMGPLTLSPASGHAGGKISTTANGLKSMPARYQLHLGLTSSDDCMSFTGVYNLKTIQADLHGAWSNVVVKIPATATMGAHSLCAMEVSPVKGQTGSAHDTFTVT